MDEFRKVGDGSFSLGSRTWPGLSKVIEECGEVLQVAGKLMGTAGKVEHWDGAGPLDVRIAEEMCDLFAACVAFFQLNGFDGVEEYVEREADKYQTFLRWHAEGLQEPEDKVTEPDTGIPKDLRDRLIEAWNFGQFADDLDVPLAGSIRADIRQLCNVLERMPFAAPARRSSPQTPDQVEARVQMAQPVAYGYYSQQMGWYGCSLQIGGSYTAQDRRPLFADMDGYGDAREGEGYTRGLESKVPLEAINKLLADCMDVAVQNGANSVSMPDHYVEVAAWICGVKDVAR